MSVGKINKRKLLLCRFAVVRLSVVLFSMNEAVTCVMGVTMAVQMI